MLVDMGIVVEKKVSQRMQHFAAKYKPTRSTKDVSIVFILDFVFIVLAF